VKFKFPAPERHCRDARDRERGVPPEMSDGYSLTSRKDTDAPAAACQGGRRVAVSSAGRGVSVPLPAKTFGVGLGWRLLMMAYGRGWRLEDLDG
jgi:hypothetical protein